MSYKTMTIVSISVNVGRWCGIELSLRLHGTSVALWVLVALNSLHLILTCVTESLILSCHPKVVVLLPILISFIAGQTSCLPLLYNYSL